MGAKVNSYAPLVNRLREDHRIIYDLLSAASAQSKDFEHVCSKFRMHEESEEKYFLPLLNRLELVLSDSTSTRRELMEIGEEAYKMLPYLDRIEKDHQDFKKFLSEVTNQRLRERILNHIMLEEGVFLPLLRNIANLAKNYLKAGADQFAEGLT